ncbi:hypothetical protein F4780DRAFT_1059 [Xylariomycetidae sp. FL0641]|nr:hypothetical protein F4780DRAFT_1059 [Xylariomycetidae sp. FL0641]
MSDSLCGPSNALKGFSRHVEQDRSLQQDARRPQVPVANSQNFRTGYAGAPAAADMEFASFQGVPGPAVPAERPGMAYVPILEPLSNGGPPNGPGGRCTHVGNAFRPVSHAQPNNQGGTWAQDYQSIVGNNGRMQQLHIGQGDGLAPAMNTSRPYMNAPQPFMNTSQPLMHGLQPSWPAPFPAQTRAPMYTGMGQGAQSLANFSGVELRSQAELEDIKRQEKRMFDDALDLWMLQNDPTSSVADTNESIRASEDEASFEDAMDEWMQLNGPMAVAGQSNATHSRRGEANQLSTGTPLARITELQSESSGVSPSAQTAELETDSSNSHDFLAPSADSTERDSNAQLENDTELARAAQTLVDSVSDNETQKFRDSEFLKMMRRIAAGEMTVRDNDLVGSVEASLVKDKDNNANSDAAEAIHEATGAGRG